MSPPIFVRRVVHREGGEGGGVTSGGVDGVRIAHWIHDVTEPLGYEEPVEFIFKDVTTYNWAILSTF